MAFFQLPEGQRNPNHLLFSSLINSLGMVSNQTHRVIKGSHHTLSFRKFQKFQNFSEFTNSASRYTCSVCFLSKLLGVCDKFIFLCYRALNTQVVTEKSWEDPNGSCQAIIDLWLEVFTGKVLHQSQKNWAIFASGLCWQREEEVAASQPCDTCTGKGREIPGLRKYTGFWAAPRM